MRCGSLRSILVCLLFPLAARTVQGQVSLGDVRLAAFGGPAYFTSAVRRPFEMALSADASLFRPRRSNVGAGLLVEGGLFHPAISGKGNYYFSTDAMLGGVEPERAAAGMKLRPFAVAGYSRFFNASDAAIDMAHGVNFGVGVDRVLRDDLWLRVEFREHYTPGSDSHALILRIGVVAVGSMQ